MKKDAVTDAMSVPHLVGYAVLTLVAALFVGSMAVLVGLATARPWRIARVTCGCGYRHAASEPECPSCRAVR